MNIRSLVNGVKRRFDVIDKQIERSLTDLRILENIRPLKENKWLEWYKNSYIEKLTYLKINRFIPAKLIPIRYRMQKAIESIRQDDKLILDEIRLPYPDADDMYAFYTMISESLLEYLLREADVAKDDYMSVISTAYDGPYEMYGGGVQLVKGDVVIDAGANIGEFSALAGNKGCKVYAFEPMPHVVERYLSKTAKMNKNILIQQYALSDQREDLFFDGGTMVGSTFIKSETKNGLKVKGIDLDTFVKENKLEAVDFIKADIEGAERYMIMGSKWVLKEFAPKLALCTYHLPDDSQVLRKLIHAANPHYVIEEKWNKMFAYVPDKT
jgi:FkbM family methyltransferase